MNPSEEETITVKAGWQAWDSIYDITYMHQMTTALCDNTTTPNINATTYTTTYSADKTKVPQVTLTDIRDGEKYIVRKLADGHCWMVQNLRTPPSTLLKAIYSDNTSDYTLPASDALETNTGNTYTPHMYATSSDIDGNGYNWAASVAGNTSNTAYSDKSICPKNWQLPTGQSGSIGFNKLIEKYGSLISTWKSFPLEVKTQGYAYVYGGWIAPSHTYFYNQYRSELFRFDASNNTNVSWGDPNYGHKMYIRCVSR